jgi:F0F1-type ATP synthase epsilon subunit
MDKTKGMQVKIYAPFRTYYDGAASSMSAVNKTGPFDILPQHHNFMSLLVPSEITVRSEGKPDFKMKVERGVVHVKADQATVFLDV